MAAQAPDQDRDGIRLPEPVSAVSVWRTSGGKRLHSVRVVAGTTQAELDELVDMAIATERRLLEQRAAT